MQKIHTLGFDRHDMSVQVKVAHQLNTGRNILVCTCFRTIVSLYKKCLFFYCIRMSWSYSTCNSHPPICTAGSTILASLVVADSDWHSATYCSLACSYLVTATCSDKKILIIQYIIYHFNIYPSMSVCVLTICCPVVWLMAFFF